MASPSLISPDLPARVGPYRNRIVGFRVMRVTDLLDNPHNWRLHPQAQLDALDGILNEVGVIAAPIFNQQTGNLFDGHGRKKLYLADQEAVTPVIIVDLSPEEEKKALLTFDPLSALAEANNEALAALMQNADTQHDAVRQLLADMAASAGLDTFLIEQGDGSPSPESWSLPFDHESILDAAMAHHREHGFPYRNVPIFRCMQEINRLARSEHLLRTSTAYHVADTFHPHRFHAAAAGQHSPFDSFHDDKRLRKALRFLLEQGSGIPEGYPPFLSLVDGTQACSNFRPGFAAMLYRRFCQPGDTVLDTSTGYGGRLVGFMASGVAGKYIGIDPNVPTHEANTRMVAALDFSDQVELHNLPAEDVSHVVVAGRCDFAFTSPPYFSKERYSDDDTQSWKRYRDFEGWVAGFLAPMLTLQYAALKPGAYAALNIADVNIYGKVYPLVKAAKEAATSAGFLDAETLSFPLPQRRGIYAPERPAVEPVLVFRKPEGATA